jgi:alkylated DNA repair dioxygenase AlkB
MDLTHRRSWVKLPIRLPRRRLLVMRGTARYDWQLGIAARKSDTIDGRLIRRERRVSLTFR